MALGLQHMLCALRIMETSYHPRDLWPILETGRTEEILQLPEATDGNGAGWSPMSNVKVVELGWSPPPESDSPMPVTTCVDETLVAVERVQPSVEALAGMAPALARMRVTPEEVAETAVIVHRHFRQGGHRMTARSRFFAHFGTLQ